MKTRINPLMVSHIEITPLKNSGYMWVDEVKEKRIFFNLIQTIYPSEGGFWENGSTSYWSDKLIERQLKATIVKNGVAYWKPYLAIFSGGKQIEGKYYKTIDEIYKVCDELFPNVNIVLK